jgi:hypothetical protein
LLEVRGLDENWENGVQSFRREADEQQQEELPDAILRLHNPDSTRMFDAPLATAVVENAVDGMPGDSTPTANLAGRENDRTKVVCSMARAVF